MLFNSNSYSEQTLAHGGARHVKSMQPWQCGEIIGDTVASLQGALKATRLKTAFIAFVLKRKHSTYYNGILPNVR